MVSIRFVAIFSFFSCFSLSGARAEESISFWQSENFWDVASKMQNGVSDLAAANQILERLYGHPEGDQLTLSYQNDRATDSIKLKEFKIEQMGFVYASNPVLPSLFGWLGAGPALTVAYEFADIFAGHYWARYVNAASTDLIDRPLLQADQLSYGGLGFNFTAELGDANPLHLEFHSKHAYFISHLLGSEWVHRMNVLAIMHAAPSVGFHLILGPEPTPSFETRSLVWDYLWKTDLQSEFLSLIGGGVDLTPVDNQALHFLFGFYGGYHGGGIYWKSESFSLSISSYGLETAAAYQARQLRTFGASATVSL